MGNLLRNIAIGIVSGIVVPALIAWAGLPPPYWVIGGLIAAGVLYTISHAPQLGWRRRVLSVATMIAGTLILIAGAFWFRSQKAEGEAPEESTPLAEAKADAPATEPLPRETDSNGGTVQQSIQFVPMAQHAAAPAGQVAVPEAGKTLIVVECEEAAFQDIPGANSTLMLFPAPGQSRGGTAMATGKGGATAKAELLGITHRCRMTNYGPATLVNVRIPIRLNFYEAQVTRADGGGTNMQQGPLLVSNIGLIPVPRLDAGPANSFEFFIANNSQRLAIIEFPTAGEARRVDRDAPEPLPITTTMAYPIQSWPQDRKL